MPTLYNLTLEIGRNRKGVSNEAYFQAYESLKSQGLIGDCHVNHFGRVLQGIGLECRTLINAYFDVDFIRGQGLTPAKELEEKIQKTDPDDYEKMMRIDEDENTLLFLFEKNPELREISSRELIKHALYRGMAIRTSFGILPLIFMARNRGISFYKPREDRFWYDWDVFCSYAHEIKFKAFSLGEWLKDPSLPKEERIKIQRALKKLRKPAKKCKEVLDNPEKALFIPDEIEEAYEVLETMPNFLEGEVHS